MIDPVVIWVWFYTKPIGFRGLGLEPKLCCFWNLSVLSIIKTISQYSFPVMKHQLSLRIYLTIESRNQRKNKIGSSSSGEGKRLPRDEILKQKNCQDFSCFKVWCFIKKKNKTCCFNQMECTWVGFTGNNISGKKKNNPRLFRVTGLQKTVKNV